MISWAEVAIPTIECRFSIPQLHLMNTSSHAVEALEVKNHYRMYVCGITPYDATHLGHANTYLAFDLINRYLRATGAQVSFVENITDIDDPLLERANRDGVDWVELAHSQIELFRSDMVGLHILPPKAYIGAVEAIPLVTDSIEILQRAGSAYLVEKDLYFSVKSDPEFGERSHLSESAMLEIFAERGGDPSRLGKKDPLDALLWLSQRPQEPGWPSPFGDGRPGWHIECCAIALHYLTPHPDDEFSIDIQGGGSDLIFPHHEMSAAQARVLTGKRFARFFVHAGMIGLDGEKMSKSKGNLVFVSKLIQQGVDPMVIRLALLSHKYSADHMWHPSEIDRAQELFDLLRLQLSRMEVAPTDKTIEGIIRSLSNDLDTPMAIEELKKWVKETENGKVGGHPGELSRVIDALLGIAF
jgi:L-cysteine:1D-myo-inositol 2-amino-2-deoxy-alpha-D-glucopyranoside ligase